MEIMKALSLGLTKFDDKYPDINTEFPTSDAVRFQALLRGEAKGLDLLSSGIQADIIGQIMWSWQRKSREREFVTALVGMATFEENARIRYGALGDWKRYIEPQDKGKEK